MLLFSLLLYFFHFIFMGRGGWGGLVWGSKTVTTSLSVCFYFLLFLITGNLTMGVSWSSPQTYVKDCWSSHSPCLMLSANAGSGMAFFKKLSMDFRRAALCGKHWRPRGRIKIRFSFTCVQELLTELVQYLEGKRDSFTLTKTDCQLKMALLR